MDGEKREMSNNEATRKLWSVIQHSGYYDPFYTRYISKIKYFAEMEQLYVCMIAEVSHTKIDEIFHQTGLDSEARTKALQALWEQTMAKLLPMPDEQATKKLEEARERIGALELQLTRMQADLSRFFTAQRRASAAIEQPPPSKEAESSKAAKKGVPQKAKQAAKGGTPKEAVSGAIHLEKLERQFQDLKGKVVLQERDMKVLQEQLKKWKDEGSQVRAIVLEDRQKPRMFSKKGQKRYEEEKERIDRMRKEGYDAGQMDFLISCRNEGLSWEFIDSFAGKEIPLSLMKKLKDYYLKKEDVPESGTQERSGANGERPRD